MKLLLLLLLLPVCLYAQEVQPVLSNDYLALINKDSLAQKSGFRADTTNSMKNAALTLTGNYTGGLARGIKIRQGTVAFQPIIYRMLWIGGNFNSTVEVKSINRLPGLQTTFVQGRSANGALAWRGPETGELFSYGPAVNTLEFDGSNYAYDTNGKLVALGAGNGKNARAYDNNIFRTATLTSQSFNIQGKYFVSGKPVLNGSLTLGQSRENTFIKSNTNHSDNLLASLETFVKWLSIGGSYNYIRDRFSNSNRNGFLNRVYQNSMLSPASFDNSQGPLIGTMQRSYSPAADNPFFLLEDNGNGFHQTHKTGTLVFEKKPGPFKFKLTQSIESLHQNSDEGYKAGTAFFANGAALRREKNDENYFLKGDVSYDIDYGHYYIRSLVAANYIYSNNRSGIDYSSHTAYRYQRSSQDFALSYFTNYTVSYFEAGLTLSNKFYFSNTATSGSLLLPAVTGFVRLDNVFGFDYLSAKFTGSFSRFNNELPIDRSFSQNSLLQYSTQQAFQYFPVTEVAGFDNLSPIRHTELTGRMELNYKNKIDFSAELFRRNTRGDVFPLPQNGAPVLKNIADHRNNGIELQLSSHSNIEKIRFYNSVSFFANRSKVTHVADGYNFMPVTGFSDVYKAIVQGEAPGVIVGSSWLKDAGNNRVIGNDGFPIAGSTPVVLGNPIPDFVMKIAHTINWKKLSLALDWEWKKGGTAWNGTQAALDYYGRSESSGHLRNTTGYVFAGVLQNGHINNIPVSFYDPASPVENNRWTRYGPGGIAEDYIQKTDHIRLNNISLTYRVNSRKYVQNIAITLYATNILVWSAYKGADPNQLLYDQPNTSGLDFFNLPSTKNIGCNLAVQF